MNKTMNKTMQAHLEIDDNLIISNLASNKYDIKQLETKFIVYCMFLINIQIQLFDSLINKNNVIENEEAIYYDGGEFKNDENDLLNLSNTLKLTRPFMEVFKKEIKENRKITVKEYIIINDECKKEYIIKNNVI